MIQRIHPGVIFPLRGAFSKRHLKTLTLSAICKTFERLFHNLRSRYVKARPPEDKLNGIARYGEDYMIFLRYYE